MDFGNICKKFWDNTDKAHLCPRVCRALGVTNQYGSKSELFDELWVEVSHTHSIKNIFKTFV
jgi:hypothetical protein